MLVFRDRSIMQWRRPERNMIPPAAIGSYRDRRSLLMIILRCPNAVMPARRIASLRRKSFEGGRPMLGEILVNCVRKARILGKIISTKPRAGRQASLQHHLPHNAKRTDINIQRISHASNILYQYSLVSQEPSS